MESWDESPEDRASYRDSDQFDEDSLSVCSWFSENEIIGGLTWKGWKNNNSTLLSHSGECCEIPKLLDVAAKVVAACLPFQAVEEYKPPVPEQVQMKVAFWSFPQKEDDIRLYSCIAHGKADEFQIAELILKQHQIKDVLQIGFHLTGLVMYKFKSDLYKVSITFDRCQIVTSICSCNPNATWCAHIIALCLFRMRFPELVCFRAPISESLSKLQRDQLQKFTQYLIYELPSQVLPTAQRLLDELLLFPLSRINQLNGAPDPTAGAGFIDMPKWLLDVEALRDNIRKILCKFYGPSPVAFVDFSSTLLSTAAPTSSVEWMGLLRPYISREPEGLWNLLDIIKDLFQAGDPNSSEILQIVTEECLNVHQLSLWWFSNGVEEKSDDWNSCLSPHALQSHTGRNVTTIQLAKNAGVRLLDECVDLWKTALINPGISLSQKQIIRTKLELWQKSIIEKAKRAGKSACARENFTGFQPAIDVTGKNWGLFLAKFGVQLGEVASLASEAPSQQTLFESEEQNTLSITFEEIEDLFTCIYALDALGFTCAKRLAVTLATKLLSISVSEYQHFSIAVKSSFLCRVLKDYSCQHLAFKLALFALAFPRKPAVTKSEEVKLLHCELNLRSALMSMTIGIEELELVRSCAYEVSSFKARNRRQSKPHSKPLIFSIYVLEVLTEAAVQSRLLKRFEKKFSDDCNPTERDKEIGYQFAISSLAWGRNMAEMKHTMLCESMRQFRNDLSLTLLWHYQNDVDKLDEILSFIFTGTDGKTEDSSSDSQKPQEAAIPKEDASGQRFLLLEKNSCICKTRSGGSNQSQPVQTYEVNQCKNWDAEIILASNKVGNETLIAFSEPICDNIKEKDAESKSCGFTLEQQEVDKFLQKNVAIKNSETDCNVNKSVKIKNFDLGANTQSVHSKGCNYIPISGEVEVDLKEFQTGVSPSWYLDGKNTWDPALSWAERCESQEDFFLSSLDLGEGSTENSTHSKGNKVIYDFHLECDSFALFELAKELHTKAVDRNDTGSLGAKAGIVPGQCKSLQIISFKLAIFSLQLQNRTSPKWLSRTYSPHVAWIADKSVEIGFQALQILNEKWENTLTPTESLGIASRTWRAGDASCKRAAAELAVSCLPQAHTLNPGEIQEAINLCKEQDFGMLERACASIETASVQGGIQPEILFYVARQWQVIHEHISQDKDTKRKFGHEKSYLCSSSTRINTESRDFLYENGQAASKSDKESQHASFVKQRIEKMSSIATAYKGLKLEPSAFEEEKHEGRFSDKTVRTAEQHVQRQMHRMAQEMMKQSFFQQKSGKASNDSSIFWANRLHAGMQNQHENARSHSKSNVSAEALHSNPFSGVRWPNNFESCRICTKLNNAFRIGMRALQALAGRGLEERPDVKFAPSSPCSDDVRWLCALAASLGPPYLRSFCANVTPSVCSPYLLHDLALEAARNFAIYSPAQPSSSHLQSPAVYPIVLKCLAMYTDLVRRDLVLLTQAGYPDFVELLRRVRSAFCMAPGGMTRFNELLEMIKKSFPKKRDLWQPIMNGLSRA